MFGSILVANRGEIAARIFRTAKRLSMRTVAVCSDADARAKHVREADVAVGIGPAPAAQSYLRGDAIIAAAQETGAEAIHPGYGFLSENPEFAEAVIAAGLIWIGPPPAAIRAMGLKDEAKRIAEEAGVPVLPGYRGADQSEKALSAAAKDIGYPVLIKALAGGGGRGIREVRSAKEFKDQLASAQREAKAAFGDDRVLVEKLVERPRHIEVQVFGDAHGEVVHLFERDCSLQRRRQKVVEEAPAPGMTQEVRAAMTSAAVKVARAVGYQNAGTVEFIVDGVGALRPDGFWFLEMNTRLQVEHPVTEMITGLDLVEWQLRVAAGEKLPLRQNEITLTGHAIEARICAEDPAEGFRPSVGRLARCRWPKARIAPSEAVRSDVGFEEGDVVPSAYDSMIGKVIVWSAQGRSDAIGVLQASLGELEVLGCTTNAHFIGRCLALNGAFAGGEAHVGWIAEHIEGLVEARPDRARAAAALVRHRLAAAGGRSPWETLDGWRMNAAPRARWLLTTAEGPLEVEAAGGRLTVDGVDAPEGGGVGAILDDGVAATVFLNGRPFVFFPLGANADLGGAEAGDEVKAPLPGKIVAVVSVPGATVKKGDPLLTLEAMKMEHQLKAPRDGVVAEIAVGEGAQVGEGAVLVRLAPA